VEEVKGLGHRIEHFECSTDDHLRRAASLGLRASVQPAFDHYWGGDKGLYAERIGWDRAAGMNRFASMLNAGLIVGAGSDSTVTPMDPFLQLAALRGHHIDDEQLGRIEALRLHTTGARALATGPSLAGSLEPAAPADLVWLDRNPATISVEDLLDTEVLGTWVLGQRVWPETEAEVS
jgi:predicted amidohydrolase YtcJ